MDWLIARLELSEFLDRAPRRARMSLLNYLPKVETAQRFAIAMKGTAMKALFVAVIFAASTSMAFAQYSFGTGSNSRSTYVQPRINSNGSYTGGHYRTTPNNTQMDNYGTRGNYNPYTGRTGTRTPRY